MLVLSMQIMLAFSFIVSLLTVEFVSAASTAPAFDPASALLKLLHAAPAQSAVVAPPHSSAAVPPAVRWNPLTDLAIYNAMKTHHVRLFDFLTNNCVPAGLKPNVVVCYVKVLHSGRPRFVPAVDLPTLFSLSFQTFRHSVAHRVPVSIDDHDGRYASWSSTGAAAEDPLLRSQFSQASAAFTQHLWHRTRDLLGTFQPADLRFRLFNAVNGTLQQLSEVVRLEKLQALLHRSQSHLARGDTWHTS